MMRLQNYLCVRLTLAGVGKYDDTKKRVNVVLRGILQPNTHLKHMRLHHVDSNDDDA